MIENLSRLDRFRKKTHLKPIEVEEEITEVKQVFQKGQVKITDTLAAIMSRLTIMEEKQDVVAQKMAQFQYQYILQIPSSL